jgi:hypothetical protein
MEDFLITRKIIEELDKKIFNSESILNTRSLEVYKVEYAEDQIIFIFKKMESRYNSMTGKFFLYIPKDKITSLLGKVYKKLKKPYVIMITVYTDDPRKKLKDIIIKDRSIRFEYYMVCSHETAHYLLLRILSEESRKNIGEMSKYARDLCSYSINHQMCVDFYIRNLLSVRTYFEIYAYSVSLLTILDMLKGNKISVKEAKEFFGKLLFFFFYNGVKFNDKYIINGKLEVKDVEDLEKLDHLYASHIISSILLEKLGKDKIVELYENFEYNIDIIEELFKEIKEYSKLKFFEEVGKLQQI